MQKGHLEVAAHLPGALSMSPFWQGCCPCAHITKQVTTLLLRQDDIKSLHRVPGLGSICF
jgi:hypothetical protein